MRVAYIDGNAGVSGDMLLGALIHAGWSIEALKNVASSLGLDHVNITESQVEKNHIVATQVNIQIPHEHEHRGLADIIKRINESGLEIEVCNRAISVFKRLAEAEAKIHGISVEKIHFHEVGAVDAMIDIVGTCKGLYDMGIEKVIVSPLRVGSGYVRCAHGEIPVPGPATSEIIKGIPCYSGDYAGEWTTPTGASLVKEWANSFGSMPAMTIQSVGMGAGQANPPFPNLLRVFVGEINLERQDSLEFVYIVETEIDDMPGEHFSYLNQVLFDIPVKDFYVTPIYMKKNRPGQLLTVIVDKDNVNQVTHIMLKETSTFGVRVKETQRLCLDRELILVKIGTENVHVKLGRWEKQIIKMSPEYEDCKKAAITLNIPLENVYEMAKIEAKKLLDKGGLSVD